MILDVQNNITKFDHMQQRGVLNRNSLRLNATDNFNTPLGLARLRVRTRECSGSELLGFHGLSRKRPRARAAWRSEGVHTRASIEPRQFQALFARVGTV